MKPTKIFIAAALASIMTLTSGCSLLLPPISTKQASTTPEQFKQDDNSYAMNVLNAGWAGEIPFNISDTEIPEDALGGNSNAGLYVTQATLGTLANGLIGGAFGLASVAIMTPTSHWSELVMDFMWIPANGRDINNMKDRKELADEITTDYIEPMFRSFFAESHKGIITASTKGSFSFKGSWCSRKNPEEICKIDLSSSGNLYTLRFASYADKQHGLPFKTNNDGKFIIVNVRIPCFRKDIVKFSKKDNALFYIPAGEKKDPNKLQHTNIPYILSSTGEHFFTKPAHKIND